MKNILFWSVKLTNRKEIAFFNKLVSIYNDFMFVDADVKFNFIITNWPTVPELT